MPRKVNRKRKAPALRGRPRKRPTKSGGSKRRTRCKTCQRLGYASVARRNGGACQMCGGNFFTELLGHIANGINAISRWRNPNNYAGVSSFPAAVANRNAYKPVNPLAYTYHYNAY
jgi:hypothetical protein